MNKFIFNEEHGRLLKYFADNFSTKSIAKELNCTRRNIYKRRDVLVKRGYIKVNKNSKNNKGEICLYELTSKGSMALEKYLGLSSKVHNLEQLKHQKNIIRLHNLTFRFPLMITQKKLIQINNKLIKLNIFSEKNIKSRGMTNWYQTFYKSTEVQLRTTSKSLIVRLTGEYFAHTPEEAINQAVDDLTHSFIAKIESWFNIKLGKHNAVTADILTQHFAISNNELAKQCLKAGFTQIKLKDENGETRFIIDNSGTRDRWGKLVNLNEAEFVHRIKGEEDVIKYKKHISHVIFDDVDIKKTSDEVQGINATLQSMTSNLSGINQTMQTFGTGMSEHMKLIGGLQDVSKQLLNSTIMMGKTMNGIDKILLDLKKAVGMNKTKSNKKFKKKNTKRNKRRKKKSRVIKKRKRR